MAIPNLTSTICPQCGAVDSLSCEEVTKTIRKVAGLDEDGTFEFLPNSETYYSNEDYQCDECKMMVFESDVADATWRKQ